MFFLDHVHGNFDEVADDGFHISTHITHLGELGGFHFHKRGVGQFGEASGDFGFTHAGGADHEDVLGQNLVFKIGGHHLATAPVAKGNGAGSFGFVLADNELIELFHNFTRRQVGQCSCNVHDFFSHLVNCLHGDVFVGVDADVGCDLHGFFNQFLRAHFGVSGKRLGGGIGEMAARTNGHDAFVRLD